jgi:hypothetical protein
MTIPAPEKRYPPFTREWCEEIAKREGDGPITAGVPDIPCTSCEGTGFVTWEEGTDDKTYPCPNCSESDDLSPMP